MMLKKLINICTMAILVALMSACATKQPTVLDSHFMAEPMTFKVIDKRAPEMADAVFTKSGNVYSCQYGIHIIENNQVVPERLEYLAYKLNKDSAGALSGKTIIVDRFTIYRNAHIETLRGATFGILGGAVGGTIAAATEKNVDGIPLATADWDTAGNPTGRNSKLGDLVGCDESYSGSYWGSELHGGVAPFVLYFDASIDNSSYKLHLVQPTTQEFLVGGQFAEQLRLAIDRISQEFLKKVIPSKS
jgi:hypothetical protein